MLGQPPGAGHHPRLERRDRLVVGADGAVEPASERVQAPYEPAQAGSDFEGTLLDTLAVVGLSRSESLTRGVEAFRSGGGDGLLVAILGSLAGVDLESLGRLRHGSTSAVAFLLDTPSWLMRADGNRQAEAAVLDSATRAMLGHGWQVVPVRSTDTLPALWPRAAHGSLPPVEAPAVVTP